MLTFVSLAVWLWGVVVLSSLALRRSPNVDLVGDDDDDDPVDFGHRCEVVAVHTSSKSTHSKDSCSAVCLWQNVFVIDNNWFSGSYTNLSLKMQLNSTIDLRIRYWSSLYVSLSFSLSSSLLSVRPIAAQVCVCIRHASTPRKHARAHTHALPRTQSDREKESESEANTGARTHICWATTAYYAPL